MAYRGCQGHIGGTEDLGNSQSYVSSVTACAGVYVSPGRWPPAPMPRFACWRPSTAIVFSRAIASLRRIFECSEDRSQEAENSDISDGTWHKAKSRRYQVSQIH